MTAMDDREALPRTRYIRESREIAPRPVTIIAAEHVASIDRVIETLVTWGVKLPVNDRLSQARHILIHAAQTGEIAPTQRGDDLGLVSLEVLLDYSAIALTLPAKRVADLRRTLERSLEGPLRPTEDFLAPVQLQAQLVVRAAFACAGVEPEDPTRSPRLGVRPDLLLRRNGVIYGVEVKRPKSEAGLTSRFDDARNQLVGYGVRGAVLVDVTDCLRSVPRDAMPEEIHRFARTLYDRAFVNGQGFKAGFESVMMAGVFARVGWSSKDYADHAIVDVHTLARLGVLAEEEGSVLDFDAQWIRTNFKSGFDKLYELLVPL